MILALTWIWCVGVFHLVVAAAAFESTHPKEEEMKKC